MNDNQRELCAEAREDIDCALDCLQDLAGELDDGRDDRPILDSILVDLLAIKDQLSHAEQSGQLRPQIPPTQRGLSLPEIDA